jgi:hypothetical protein
MSASTECSHKKAGICSDEACGGCKRCPPKPGCTMPLSHPLNKKAAIKAAAAAESSATDASITISRPNLERDVKKPKILNEDKLLEKHSNAIAIAVAKNSAPDSMDVVCKVLDCLGITYTKKLGERRSRVSRKDNERMRELVKVAVAATQSLLSFASDDEETLHQLITGASLLMRPPVESETGGYAVADVFMRTATNNCILQRELASILLSFPDRKRLLSEAFVRARNDVSFFTSFKEQFRVELEAESKRGSRSKSDEPKRQPRDDRASLVQLAIRELMCRRDWFDKRVAVDIATKDFDTLMHSQTLGAQFNKDRTDPRCWDIALNFIAVCCKEQWRPGKTQSACIGNTVATNLPFLQREQAIEQIWNAYKEEAQKNGGDINGVSALGRETFCKLVGSVTKEVEEKACLSYYYTDFLAACDLIDSICARLNLIWEQANIGEFPLDIRTEVNDLGVTVASLSNYSEQVRAFGKYELYKHVETTPGQCGGCCIHCAAYAVGSPCSVEQHSPKCEECMAFRSVPRLINTFRNGMRCALVRRKEHFEQLPVVDNVKIASIKLFMDELLTMHQALAYVESVLLLFMQHVMRGEWQAKRIDEVIDQVNERFVVAHFDHRMKQTLRKRNESTEEHFGQSGESVLGVCVYFRTGPKEECPVQTRFFDYVVDDNRQNPQQVQSILDCFMKDDLPDMVPTAEEVAFLSDNGSAFATFDHCPWIVERNDKNWYRDSTQPISSTSSSIASIPTVRVVRAMYFEAQRGKGLVDCHFAFLGKQVKRAVNLNMTVGPPSTIFEAFVLNGGVMNTMTILLEVNAKEKRVQMPSNTATNMGIRRVHDIKFVGKECVVYSQINSKYVHKIDVKSVAEKVGAPTYRITKKHIAISEGKFRPTKVKDASSISVSESFNRERPFVQNMLNSVIGFVEGKAVSRKLVLPSISFAEPLRMGAVETLDEGDGEATAPTEKLAASGKKKKVGLELIPVEDDLFHFDGAWTWKINRQRPSMNSVARARIQELVR